MDLRVRRAGVAGALTAVLLLAGCSAGGSDSSMSHGAAAAADKGGAPAQAPGAATPGKGAANGAAGSAGAGTVTTEGTVAPATNRQIAYQAHLTVRVDAVDQARTRAVDLVVQAGGYVSGENLRGGPGDSQQSTLTLKVPSASYQTTLDALGKLGVQVGLSSQADDLTQQIADVDSRVKSMQASVDRVRALMADAKSLAEVVSLESELTRRESDLESLQRQQQELSSRTSLSTVTLDLVTARQPVRAEPKQDGTGFWASVGHALAGGWHALLAFFRVLLVVLAAAAPFLLILAPVVWLLLRRLRRTR